MHRFALPPPPQGESFIFLFNFPAEKYEKKLPALKLSSKRLSALLRFFKKELFSLRFSLLRIAEKKLIQAVAAKEALKPKAIKTSMGTRQSNLRFTSTLLSYRYWCQSTPNGENHHIQ